MSDTRQKMLASAIELLRERGAGAVTVDAILARSGAPRGSVYHHFPGGRNQIIEEALDAAGQAISGFIDRSAAAGPIAALRDFTDFWIRILLAGEFRAGCPVVAVAAGGAPDEQRLAPAAADIFAGWSSSLTRALEVAGAEPARAQRLATLAIAAIEGAVVLCRVSQSTAALEQVRDELETMLASALGDSVSP